MTVVKSAAFALAPGAPRVAIDGSGPLDAYTPAAYLRLRVRPTVLPTMSAANLVIPWGPDNQWWRVAAAATQPDVNPHGLLPPMTAADRHRATCPRCGRELKYDRYHAGGGTLETVGGAVPSRAESDMLVEDAGGTVQRIEGPHLPPSPHEYPHINYTTSEGLRGTVQIAP